MLHPVYSQIVTAADMLKSTIRIGELISFLQQENAKAVAITNSKFYGLLPFWHALKKTAIHPVIGLTVQVEFSTEDIRPVVLYAKNMDGYHNLLKITSSISLRDSETLPLRWLEGYHKGCITLVPVTSDTWQQEAPFQAIEKLMNIFGVEHLVIGIDRPGGIRSHTEESVVTFCSEHSIKICATHLSTFAKEEHAFTFEVAKAISTGVKMADQEKLTLRESKQFLPTRQNYKEWFDDHPEWLQATEEILLSCQVELDYDRFYMPKFPLPEGETAAGILQKNCLKGLQDRIPNAGAEYHDRLAYELDVITNMGYADYFLIVADYIQYARKKHILTGPGRGSSASSLVAYVLRITEVDPLKYGLLFERFLNPERITMPDIDVDFADYRRQEVIDYVAEKYGANYTSQIITFGTLSAKAVARDVARVFGFNNEELAHISTLIPGKVGITLQEAVDQSETLRSFTNSSEIRQQWMQVAMNLEGLPRNASTHAAGVVLCPEPLVNVAPIEKGNEGLYLTQWPMQEVESIGLLKMDFLGLRNLTILERIRSMIYYDQKRFLQFEKIPLHDQKTFELLQNGDTTGVFQLESDGMRQALREIRPTVFQDIVAVNALYRPGPMDFIPVYSRRKHGQEKVEMPHPVLEPILGETYGVIVYQEQIMLIASRMAGFTMGEADILRRAVSKKKKEVLDSERAHFVRNSIDNGFSEQIAVNVYNLIVRFANYGFPKSHAVAYSMISYQMAYLKAHFPAYFYAAMLTSTMGNREKFNKILQEAKQKGIAILPPSINESGRSFRVQNGAIRFALSAIKGVPQTFLNKVMEIRKADYKKWQDIFDMALDLTAVHFTRKSVEPLVKAGALDEFGRNRAELLATIDAAVKHAELYRPNEEGQLLDDLSFFFGKPKHAKASPIPEKIKLQFEKEVLGFYISTHPVQKVKREQQIESVTADKIRHMTGRQYVKMVGLVASIKQIRTKKGELMGFVELEDETGSISVTIFPKEYLAIVEWIKEEQMMLAEGIVEMRNGQPQIILKKCTVISS
ncbi:DNA polymerase III subunit alpha [Rummeliibacillus pycnus]|uniref:DNA polymerase III subunit alpha n=1 Tax=Rummeliibacillus pycnus TaxID=101070 RepID=UPI0037CA7820